MLRTFSLLLLALPLLAAPIPKGATQPFTVNSNALLKAHAGKVVADASSSFSGWEPAKLIDGNEKSSWYSNNGDCPWRGKQPWVRVTFPVNVTVSRVTILGNREPQYPDGYSPLEGTFEFLDENGNVHARVDAVATGDKHDFDHDFVKPLTGVRAIRFTMTRDEQKLECIGLGEIQVE